MRTLLLDTDVASFLFRKDPIGDSYAKLVAGNRLAISFQTVGEMALWAKLKNWGTRKTSELAQHIGSFLLLPFSTSIAYIWADVVFECLSIGRPISIADAWIAACARHYNLPLVTHNRKDFEMVEGLEVISES